MSASPAEVDLVTQLLGRAPRADFDVVVRNATGDPVVIRNAPLLVDGTPMPTRYWLVDPEVARAVAQLESAGGVRRAEAEVDAQALRAAHDAYAAERDAELDAELDAALDAALDSGQLGPRPSGGVGGTRRGVKCLHAHYAYFLAGGVDPVGSWVEVELSSVTT